MSSGILTRGLCSENAQKWLILVLVTKDYFFLDGRKRERDLRTLIAFLSELTLKRLLPL